MRIIDVIKTFESVYIDEQYAPSNYWFISINDVKISGNFFGITNDLIPELYKLVDEKKIKERIYSFVRLKQEPIDGRVEWATIIFFKEYFIIIKSNYCDIFSLSEVREELKDQDESYLALKYGKILFERGILEI